MKYQSLREFMEFCGVKDFAALTDGNAKYTSHEFQTEALSSLAQVIRNRYIASAAADAKSVTPEPINLDVADSKEPKQPEVLSCFVASAYLQHFSPSLWQLCDLFSSTRPPTAP